MIVDDLFGWLIPNKLVEQFEERFKKNDNLNEFDKFLIWCISEIKDNKLAINFKDF